MEEGTFIGWLKKTGDLVRVGEPLFTLEGDKASQDVEASDTGVLQIAGDGPRSGDTVKVGAMLGFLLESGESSPPLPAAVSPDAEAGVAAPSPRTSPVFPKPEPCSQATFGEIGPVAIRISPRAARRAMALGVPWKDLRGTGKTGRIRERDVLAAADRITKGAGPGGSETGQPCESSPQTKLPGRLIPLSSARRAIARRLAEAARTAVPVTITTQVDASQLEKLRSRLKENALASARPAPSLQDILILLASRALGEHPLLSAQWRLDGIFFPESIHIAFAVDTQDGLVAPVLFDVPRMNLDQIAAGTRSLIELARGRRLHAADLEGGTFTISNLGSLGIDAFTPALNPPQSAVLGVGRMRKQPVVLGNEILPRELLSLSLTFDHRVVDGAPAARFLETLCRLIASAEIGSA